MTEAAQTRDVGVVIVAAGESTRTAGDELKQFRWVAGKPMLLHSLQTFMARQDVVSVVCVVPQEYVADPPPWTACCFRSAGGHERNPCATGSRICPMRRQSRSSTTPRGRSSTTPSSSA